MYDKEELKALVRERSLKFGDFVFGKMMFWSGKPMNTGVLGKYVSPPKVVLGRFLGKIIVFGKFLGNYRLFLGI